MTAINGSHVELKGTCEIGVQLGDEVLEQEFVIADIGDEAVLGVDFLEEYQCQWNWQDQTLEVNQRSVKCCLPQSSYLTSRVVAEQTTWVPPRSEVVLTGCVVGIKRAPKTGLVVGQRKFMQRRGMAVAGVLAERRGHQLPVRVMNPAEEARIISKGENVALYYPVEVMEPDGLPGKFWKRNTDKYPGN
jgi:hypothetical protein